MIRLGVLLVVSSLFLVGCGAKPRHQSVRVGETSQIQFVGLPPGSVVTVDGNAVALPPPASGAVSIPVEDGTREVAVVSNGTEILRQRIFIQDGTTKKIKLN
jgi:hypothetical protein